MYSGSLGLCCGHLGDLVECLSSLISGVYLYQEAYLGHSKVSLCRGPFSGVSFKRGFIYIMSVNRALIRI